MSLVPKGEGRKPLQQRPLTVFSVIYRLWAGIRYQHLAAWQDSWADKAICGGRRYFETQDAGWEASLDLEEAALRNSSLIALFLDYSKFFDYFVYQII